MPTEEYTVEQVKKLISPSHTGSWAYVLVVLDDRAYQRDGNVFRLLDDKTYASVKELATDGR